MVSAKYVLMHENAKQDISVLLKFVICFDEIIISFIAFHSAAAVAAVASSLRLTTTDLLCIVATLFG